MKGLRIITPFDDSELDLLKEDSPFKPEPLNNLIKKFSYKSSN